jgi:hypothetical protein
VLHIQKDGWKMYCGQSFSNRVVSREEYPNYKICKSCIKRFGNDLKLELKGDVH